MDTIINFEVRPWGNFEIIEKGSTYIIKRITVNPGKRLSLQRHKYRAEHWFFVEGTGLVTVNDLKLKAIKGISIDIGINDIHRVENIADTSLIFIEIQLGTYLSEDDIERIEDDFGR